MLLLFTLLFFAYGAYDINQLNTFSADVDIYDMGMMGRGKNACNWHRSLEKKQEVFYYLAMQPWRHLVWTDCTGAECYKFYINEDASNIPTGSTKLDYKNIENDYCRKEYAHPMATYEIDWDQIVPFSVLEAVDVNGNTCYKHPAKEPLAYIYLQKQFTREIDVDVMQPCRYDFIGGKSITFRSYNTFSSEFIGDKLPNGYLGNKTKCNIDPTPNNVDTDLAIILGVSDANVGPNLNEALKKLGELKTVKQVKVYYLSGETIKRETVALNSLASLRSKQIAVGAVDALLNSAKSDLAARINSKAIYRGTIIALMDRTLASTFDAETAFDRNNITVHTILYNPKGDSKMRSRARTLLSVGEHQHEFTSELGISTVVNELFIGLRANLTERCNRTSCNGFCDGRDRCTCPMCCENTCFFTYCNTETATCTPWPEANPKAKITCKDDCVGKQECRDLEGCVYKEYNPGCAPRAKCMRPYCDKNNVCRQESSCEADKRPSFENRCWNYTCNEQNGYCERNLKQFGNECPKLTDLCHEHVCEPITLTCKEQKKNCVKTAPYVEMECYKAQCNKRTGVCENVLACSGAVTFSGCGKETDFSNCVCDSKSGFTCKCDTKVNKDVPPEGFCKEDEICDASIEGQAPTCRESACNQDLYIEKCRIKTCDENTGYIEWVDYDCTKNVTIEILGDNKEEKDQVEEYCRDKFEIVCDPNGEKASCLARQKEGTSLLVACGKCVFTEVPTNNEYTKKYTLSYEEDCNYMKLTCPNGNEIEGYQTLFKKEGNVYITGECKTVSIPQADGSKKLVGECGYAEFNDASKLLDAFEICGSCYASMPCYKNEDIYRYTFDKETGECGVEVIGEQPGCSVCNEQQDGFIESCKDLNIKKTFEHTINGKTVNFDYHIPKLCYPEDQCIVDHEFDCSDTSNPEIKAIYDALAPCANEDGIKATYHYSQLFSEKNYDNYAPQSEEFMNEMEAMAKCTWEYETPKCHYCVIGENGLSTNDKCDDKVQEIISQGKPQDSFDYICNEYTNECDAIPKTGNCTAHECWYYYWDINVAGEDKCVNSTIGTCTDLWTEEQKKVNEWKPFREIQVKENPTLGENYPQIECFHEVKCQPPAEEGKDQLECTYDENSNACLQAYNDYMYNNKDFGCRIPEVECNFTNLHCTFKEMKFPENDTRYFQERDDVVFGDNCYEYICHEFYNETTHQVEHHWVLTEASLVELNMKPDTICDTVHCDPVTGKSISETKKCTPIEDFGLSERMAQCFQCACSLQTGENVLTMRPNTDKQTYELDACGNCVVRDRATGNQVNEVVECVLAQPVNLTGAIAGATVAASVVFGLIGSMVVVSIGAFQTYQLVSSAMKNVISTTLENPEFVAADNEATNVLNAGD